MTRRARPVTPNPHRWVDAPTVFGLGMSDRLALQSVVAKPGMPRHQCQSIRDEYNRLERDGYVRQVAEWAWAPTDRAVVACRPSVADASLLLAGDVLADGDVVDMVWEYETYYAVNAKASNGTPIIRTFDKGYRISLRKAVS